MKIRPSTKGFVSTVLMCCFSLVVYAGYDDLQNTVRFGSPPDSPPSDQILGYDPTEGHWVEYRWNGAGSDPTRERGFTSKENCEDYITYLYDQDWEQY